MKYIKEFLPYVIVIVAVLLIRNYVITPVFVDGKSMEPNLINRQILILKRYDKSLDRFDVVVFKYGKSRLVKRVIGLPGEHIEYKDSKLYVNGKEVEETMIDKPTADFNLESIGYTTIPEGYYFVVGDNRTNSRDSRSIGLISKKSVMGTVSLSLFPFNRFGFIK